MKLTRRRLIVIAGVLFVSALGAIAMHWPRYSVKSAWSVKVGMSRPEVEALLGPPIAGDDESAESVVLLWQFWDGEAAFLQVNSKIIRPIMISELSWREVWDRFWNRATYYVPPGPPPLH
jgi:hypothetical protein